MVPEMKLSRYQIKESSFTNNNARPHVPTFTGWTLMGSFFIYPQYNPNIAPSYYLFFARSDMVLMISLILHRTSEMKLISFWTCGLKVSGPKTLKNYQTLTENQNWVLITKRSITFSSSNFIKNFFWHKTIVTT